MPDYDARDFDPPAPVASVAIRRQDGQETGSDVRMLIDSGADVSLIPESSIGRLGLDTADEPTYELMAFDGTKIVARSTRCELVFLGRAYRGVYLVVGDSIGILGRDVLNQVCLVLDGPRGSWRGEDTGAAPRHEP